MSAPARHEDRRSLLFMNYIHARLFKRSLLVLSVKVAFTLLLPCFYPGYGGTRTFNLVQLHTFTVLRQNAHTFTLPPPYVFLSGSSSAVFGPDLRIKQKSKQARTLISRNNTSV